MFIIGSADDYTDSHSHGTSVTGILAATGNNGLGTAGVHWGTKILPIRACDSNGICSPLAVAKGILWALGEDVDGLGPNPFPADVVNISLQFYSLSASALNELTSAIEYAENSGAVVIASAGNDPFAGVAYPAALDSVIAVSGIDECNNFPFWSSFGDEVDLSAPGQVIFTTGLANSYISNFWGTSASTAHVSGVAALIKSFRPCLTNVEIRDVLLAQTDDLGDSGWDPYFGHGRVNAEQVLRDVEQFCQYTPIVEILNPDPATYEVDYFFGINDAGHVVGTVEEDNVDHGFYWNGDSDTAFQVFPNRKYIDINNQNNILGKVVVGENVYGYIFNTDGSIETQLSFPDQVTSVQPQAIHDNGVVVGFARTADNGYRGFVHRATGAEYIADQPDFLASALGALAWDINEQNLVAGYYSDGSPFSRAFVYDAFDAAAGESPTLPQAAMELPVPSPFAEYDRLALAISDVPSGDYQDLVIVGWLLCPQPYPPSPACSLGAVWEWNSVIGDFRMQLLLPHEPGFWIMGGFWSFDINANKQIVSLEGGNGDLRAVIWGKNGNAWIGANLKNYVPDTAWRFWAPPVINNVGQIAGRGLLETESPAVWRAYLLTLP